MIKKEVFMERGILFSKSSRPIIEYRKEYTFELGSPYFDEAIKGNGIEVTKEEAERYDAILEQVVEILFW